VVNLLVVSVRNNADLAADQVEDGRVELSGRKAGLFGAALQA